MAQALRAEIGELPEEQAAYVDDNVCARFLEARDGDVAQAARLLQGHLRWRFETYRPMDVPAEMADWLGYFPVFHAGRDKGGHPVLVSRMDRPNSMTAAQKVRTTVHQMEEAVALMDPDGAQQWTWIFDFTGFAPRHISAEYAHSFTSICQNQYPARLHTAILLNTPKLFSALWAIVNPLLDPVTRAKAHFLGSDRQTATLERLHELLPPDVVAAVLQSGEAGDLAALVPGQPPVDGFEVTGFSVPRGAAHTVDVVVAEGDEVAWGYRVTGADVSLGVLFTPSGGAGEAVEVVAPQRAAFAQGDCIAPAAGVVALVFDNSYSWVKGKEVVMKLRHTTLGDSPGAGAGAGASASASASE